MYNPIHFFPESRTFPGSPEFEGTPKEAKAYYEKAIAGLWVSHASYPVPAGSAQAGNLINMKPEREWGRLAVARYPNRRTFLELLSDPSYGPMEPYKFMALEIDLMPVSGDMVAPDLRWIVAGCFVFVFMLVEWVRAARRGRGKVTEQTSGRLITS